MWLAFFAFIAAMLAVDLWGLKTNKTHNALSWSLIWISCALIFNVLLWWYLRIHAGAEIAHQKALEFFTGYLIEKALSVDNLFVFLMIFTYFSVSAEQQRRILLYGVLGAIVLRVLMILGGTWLVSEFHWILYIFGGFLVFTGIRMGMNARRPVDLENSWFFNWLNAHIHRKFLVVLIIVEVSDLIFAVDSIPAIFAITTDPFIVLTSNIFAILGLRSLYFLLAHMADRFHLLKYGLALTLVFIGSKMLLAGWIQIPIGWSLGVVVMILISSVLLSLHYKK